MFSDRSVRVTFFLLAALGLFLVFRPTPRALTDQAGEAILQDLAAPSKAARNNYMFTMMRNPVTMAIPQRIRARELRHAAALEADARFLNKSAQTRAFNWFPAGPFDVGGRTRALAIDKNNSNRLLAGAVSGGIWESLDRGGTWHAVDLNDGNLSITYLAQDPRPGNTDTWYASSGEFIGNSASDASRSAPYFGSGIYKSSDGGKSWFILSGGQAGDEVSFDSPFDFVNRIIVSRLRALCLLRPTPLAYTVQPTKVRPSATFPRAGVFPNPFWGGSTIIFGQILQ